MIINFSDQPLSLSKKSIFLAGPTPRKKGICSWRPEACKILQSLGFDGVVYVPELSSQKVLFNYDNQIDWEWKALENAGIVIFWIPREMPDMPALTTNVEFGYYVRDSRTLYGRPDAAVLNQYLDRLYKRHHENMRIYNTLSELCKKGVELLDIWDM